MTEEKRVHIIMTFVESARFNSLGSLGVGSWLPVTLTFPEFFFSCFSAGREGRRERDRVGWQRGSGEDDGKECARETLTCQLATEGDGKGACKCKVKKREICKVYTYKSIYSI